jgi:manganese/iron transport system permease protein
LIAPGAIAFLLVRSFERMMWTATIVTLIAGVLGVYLSFWIDSAPAPTIILILTIIFIAAFVTSVRRTKRANAIA